MGVGTMEGDEAGTWRASPCRLLPLVLEQAGGGELCGRTTGAKALFCFTAEIILTGEKEKPPGGAEAAVPDGSVMEEAPSGGLAGTTVGGRAQQAHPEGWGRSWGGDGGWMGMGDGDRGGLRRGAAPHSLA